MTPERTPGNWERLLVKLSCGHQFIEHRPPRMNPPADGELRVCGDRAHYPAQYGATYFVPLSLLEVS